jgi:hypothetical protein
MAFPTTSILDNFNRANEDLTTPWLNWPLVNDNLHVISNEVGVPTSISQGNLYGISHGPDVEYYITIRALPPEGGGFSLTWRQSTTTSTDTRYFLDVNRVAGANNDTLNFGKAIAGSYTTDIGGAINLGLDLAIGDAIGIEMIGSGLTVYHKPSAGSWTSVGTRSDSSITSAGYGGIFMNQLDNKLDDFGGGTFASNTHNAASAGIFRVKRGRWG